MRRSLLATAVLVTLCFALCGRASAGANLGHKIALHVVPHGAECPTLPSFSTCSDIQTTYAGTGDIDVIPVFFELNEYLLVEFALTWPAGWGSTDYVMCAGDLSVGTIVHSGDGMATAWFECQRSWSVAHGYGWLAATGPGAVSLVRNPPTGDYGVVDCAPEEQRAYDYPAAAFNAGVGGPSGDDPCQQVLLRLVLAKADGLGGNCTHPGDTLTYTITYGNTFNTSAVHNVVLTDSLPDATTFLSASAGGAYDGSTHAVTWQLGTVGGGAQGTRSAAVVVDAPAGSVVTNVCSITTDETLATVATRSTNICLPTLPIIISKTDGVSGTCAYTGASLTYRIDYENPPTSPAAHNVILTDHLPPGVEFVSAGGGGTYDSAESTVTWTIGTLAAGQTGSRKVVARLTASPGTTITNACEIAGDVTPPSSASKSTNVCSSPFRPLALAKTDAYAASCVEAGDSLTYTITYGNTLNASDVHNVVLTDSLPDATTFVSASAGGAYDAGAHTVTWQLGTVGGGAQGTTSVTVAVGAPAGSAISNVCRITSNETPSAVATRNTSVCSGQHLPFMLGKSVETPDGCAYPGDTLAYVVVFGNQPTSLAAHNVILTDSLPSGVQFLSASGGGTYNPANTTVTWMIGTLASGQNGSRQVAAIVTGSPGAAATNTCGIVGDETPYSSGSVTTPICTAQARKLGIMKTAIPGGGCVAYGSNLTYSLAYNNNANTTEVHNVILTDDLPGQTDFLSASAGASYDQNTHRVTWNLGSLAAGAGGTQEVIIKVNVAQGVTFTNACAITSDETGPSQASRAVTVCGGSSRNAAHKIAVHVKAHPTSCTKNYPTFTSCSQIHTTYAGCGDIDALPVFYDLVEYTLTEFGLQWPGEWGTCSFARCKGDIAVGGVVHPGDGIAIAWSSCQYGWAAAPGFGWLIAASPGEINVCPNPATGDFGVVNCAPGPERYYDYPCAISGAGVCGAIGVDPCHPTRVEQTSWGAIKAMFK